MSEELVIRGKRGDFNDYEKFITKFKAAKTTDDCYTPQPIYEAVVDYVFRKGNLPEDTEIVRPLDLTETTPPKTILRDAW